MVVPKRLGPWKRVVLFPLGLIYRSWTKSLRFHPEAESISLKELNAMDCPFVIMLWHNRLFAAGAWHKLFRKTRKCFGLISASRDGAWLETFYGWAGIRAVRGSRNKRGTQAIRDLAKVLADGNDVGMTPDGSRGPVYSAKSGALALAKITKTPVLLLSFTFSRCIRLNSWDRFVIPMPFSKVSYRVKVIGNDVLFEGKSLEEATKLAESELNQMTVD